MLTCIMVTKWLLFFFNKYLALNFNTEGNICSKITIIVANCYIPISMSLDYWKIPMLTILYTGAKRIGGKI